ncbi:MAG: methylmalonyl Co-A mutase-associated GTPase MeaB, partial [Kordiimonadaceae bacterium]|nr:methylmalonyl Co-A mutase-associated GTPase MeaB [Kordiimonadaceae bacterium]
LHLMRPKSPDWSVDVLETSALNATGLEEVWQNIQSFKNTMLKNDEFEARREAQNIAAIWSELNELLTDQIKAQKSEETTALENAVKNKEITPLAAAKELLASVLAK